MYPPVESSHGEIYISNIRTNIGRSTGGPPVESSSGEEWQFYISIIKANTGRATGRSTSCRFISWRILYLFPQS